MTSGEKRILREATFDEQIQTLLAVEKELEDRWVIQKFQFDEWRGINVHAIIPDEPVSESFPITGTATYATSGEALEAMVELHARYPEVPMLVSPAREDIWAALVAPRTGRERSLFGEYPRWGELRRNFPELCSGVSA